MWKTGLVYCKVLIFLWSFIPGDNNPAAGPQQPWGVPGGPGWPPFTRGSSYEIPPEEEEGGSWGDVLSGFTAEALMEAGSDSSSVFLAENCLHGGPRPRHHRAAGRWVHLRPPYLDSNITRRCWFKEPFALLWAEIQTKRQERKRRSTANPAYSGLFEPEVRKLVKLPQTPVFSGMVHL